MWVAMAAVVLGTVAASMVIVRQRAALQRAHDTSVRILESLPDMYAPQQGARLRLQPLRIAVYGTPSLVNASSP